MNIKRIIIFSIFIPMGALLIFWALYRFYTPDTLSNKFSFTEKSFLYYSEDGAKIPGAYSIPANAESPPLIFFLSDHRLDRDWNHQAVSFRTGVRLSKLFASSGLLTVRYDQRGTGENRSQEKSLSLQDMAADFRTVYEKTLEKYPREKKRPIIIFAHGQGCLVALKAFNDFNLNADRIDLFGCAYSGSLLESWKHRILHNMGKSGISDELLKQTETEYSEWIKKGAYKDPIKEIDPSKETDDESSSVVGEDGVRRKKTNEEKHLETFRRTLDFLRSSEMHSMTLEAAEFYFDKQLQKLNAKKISINLWLGEFDNELSKTEFDSTVKLTDILKRNNPAFSYKMLARTNHFLKVQEKNTEGGLGVTWSRVNPFLKLNSELIEDIANFAQ